MQFFSLSVPIYERGLTDSNLNQQTNTEIAVDTTQSLLLIPFLPSVSDHLVYFVVVTCP